VDEFTVGGPETGAPGSDPLKEGLQRKWFRSLHLLRFSFFRKCSNFVWHFLKNENPRFRRESFSLAEREGLPSVFPLSGGFKEKYSRSLCSLRSCFLRKTQTSLGLLKKHERHAVAWLLYFSLAEREGLLVSDPL
jgi:hypothetical protein